MSDPYAQERAIAASVREANDRNERTTILEMLQKLTDELAEVKAMVSKPVKQAKE